MKEEVNESSVDPKDITHSALSRKPSVATTLVANNSSALTRLEIVLKKPAWTKTARILLDVPPNASTSFATPAFLPPVDAFPQQGHDRSRAIGDPSMRYVSCAICAICVMISVGRDSNVLGS